MRNRKEKSDKEKDIQKDIKNNKELLLKNIVFRQMHFI